MRRKIAISVIFYLLLTFSAINVAGEDTIEPFFNLVIRTAGGGFYSDYGLYIAQYLREIGIELEVKVDEWFWPYNPFNPYVLNDFDMTFSAFSDLKTQDMRDYYTEEGELNLFQLNKNIPYQNESDTMQNEAVTSYDLEESQQTYYDWEILLMDKILPLLPLFSSRRYMTTWKNTLGYDSRWGLVDSLPYIEYDGLHEGQESSFEFNIADANWRDLNMLTIGDTASSFMYSLMAEPIVSLCPDFAPLKTSLVTDWEQIDDSHFTFTMRDNMFWNPSYNVTGRDASSDALDPATTPLMAGLKDGSVSDGTNQKVTAKDAVFTYLAWGNTIVSESPTYHNWISNIYVDPVDELTFHIHIDGDPLTLELENYVEFWASLSKNILPEFFLNSSDTTVSYT
ncbi:MAG: hypothetical protein KGD64_11390, partial [Candidatus Heimdallarchaeota archaeon]|nr:hypothetical protein [Candidatus Heimdallarchaeota archaeon]